MQVNVKFAPLGNTALVGNRTLMATAAPVIIVRLGRRLQQCIHAQVVRTQLIHGCLSQVSAMTALPEAIVRLAP